MFGSGDCRSCCDVALPFWRPVVIYFLIFLCRLEKWKSRIRCSVKKHQWLRLQVMNGLQNISDYWLCISWHVYFRLIVVYFVMWYWPPHQSFVTLCKNCSKKGKKEVLKYLSIKSIFILKWLQINVWIANYVKFKFY